MFFRQPGASLSQVEVKREVEQDLSESVLHAASIGIKCGISRLSSRKNAKLCT